MPYHITAAKLIKPCKCSSCRAKHGQFATLEEAEAKLTELTGQHALPLDAEPTEASVADDTGELDFTKVRVPKTELAHDPVAALDGEELAEELEEAIANERFEDQLEEIVDENDDEEPLRPHVHALLDDDREFLKGDDEVLAAAKDSALMQQMDNVVSWHLENFYDEDDKVRGKYSLRSNPPIFRIESSDGATAEFVLSKNLVLSLSETFDTVKRGYFGISPKKKGMLTQEEAISKPQEWRQWANQHPAKAVGLALLFILCVITAFTL